MASSQTFQIDRDGLKSKNSLDFFFVRIPKSKSKSRKLTFVESYRLIDHAKQMEVVDRAHHWNHSSWNPWFRDSLQMIQTYSNSCPNSGTL